MTPDERNELGRTFPSHANEWKLSSITLDGSVTQCRAVGGSYLQAVEKSRLVHASSSGSRRFLAVAIAVRPILCDVASGLYPENVFHFVSLF